MDKTTLENLRNAPDCFAPTRELVFAMLDTISALTERAERAERERDILDHEAKLLRESAKQAWTVADGTRTALTRAEAEVSRLREELDAKS